MSTITSGRTGIVAPKASTGSGRRSVGLHRIAGLDPPVVAAIEQADVVDTGVAQDHQRAGRGDLARPPARPLLVGAADRVAAVDDDRRVTRDPEAAERLVERLRRPAVPVDRILEPVRVEVGAPGDVALRVLLRDPEVDVEQEEPAGRCGLRPAPPRTSFSQSIVTSRS
jgi:hypothetical protein